MALSEFDYRNIMCMKLIRLKFLRQDKLSDHLFSLKLKLKTI
jgi:hypothetical protein